MIVIPIRIQTVKLPDRPPLVKNSTRFALWPVEESSTRHRIVRAEMGSVERNQDFPPGISREPIQTDSEDALRLEPDKHTQGAISKAGGGAFCVAEGCQVRIAIGVEICHAKAGFVMQQELDFGTDRSRR